MKKEKKWMDKKYSKEETIYGFYIIPSMCIKRVFRFAPIKKGDKSYLLNKY